MANNITDGGTFNTANMSPDADEETAALWAQNVADNTAFNFFEPKVLTTSSTYTQHVAGNAGTAYGTLFLNNSSGYNRIRGTVSLDGAAVNANTAVFIHECLLQTFIDGTSVTNDFTASGSGTLAALHHSTGTSVDHDSSPYSHNQEIELGWRLEVKDTLNGSNETGINVGFSLYGTNV
jgi:hypothetical protein